jgi:hypothetical protein
MQSLLFGMIAESLKMNNTMAFHQKIDELDYLPINDINAFAIIKYKAWHPVVRC